VFLLRTCCTRKLFAVCHHESVWDDRKELETTRNSLIVFNQKGGVRQNIYCSFPYTLKIKGSKIICIYVHFLVPQRTILIIWRTLKEPFAQWKVIMDFKGSFAMQESLFLRVYDKYLTIWDTNEIHECLAFGLFHTQSHFITLEVLVDGLFGVLFQSLFEKRALIININLYIFCFHFNLS